MRRCLICGRMFHPNHVGRPRVFCTVRCRRVNENERERLIRALRRAREAA